MMADTTPLAESQDLALHDRLLLAQISREKYEKVLATLNRVKNGDFTIREPEDQ
jgi:hypothetical protein